MMIKKKHLLVCLSTALLFVSCGRENLNLIVRISTPAHHVETGYRMLAMNKVDDAFREFNYAAGLSPKYAPAYIGMALVHGMKQEAEKGMKSLELANRYTRGKTQELDFQVGTMRFFITMREKWKDHWLEHTETAFQKAQLLSINAPAPYYFMGRAYEMSGRFDQAAKKYFRVMEIGGKYLEESTDAYKKMEEKAGRQESIKHEK